MILSEIIFAIKELAEYEEVSKDILKKHHIKRERKRIRKIINDINIVSKDLLLEFISIAESSNYDNNRIKILHYDEPSGNYLLTFREKYNKINYEVDIIVNSIKIYLDCKRYEDMIDMKKDIVDHTNLSFDNFIIPENGNSTEGFFINYFINDWICDYIKDFLIKLL